MFAEVLSRAMKTGLHRGDADVEDFGNLGVAASFLDERKQSPVLRPELGERMAQRVKLLGVDRAGRLGDVLVLLPERQENPAQLLPAQLIDAGVAREAKEPRLKLRRSLQAIDRPHHLDEDLLRKILHVIAPACHGVDKTGDAVLVEPDELPLSGFFAFLGSPHDCGQLGRCS